MGAKYCAYCVCLSVCLLACLKIRTSKVYQVFYICCLWPELDPPRTAMRYVMYFRFVDDVIFSYNGGNRPNQRRRYVSSGSTGGGIRRTSSNAVWSRSPGGGRAEVGRLRLHLVQRRIARHFVRHCPVLHFQSRRCQDLVQDSKQDPWFGRRLRQVVWGPVGSRSKAHTEKLVIFCKLYYSDVL